MLLAIETVERVAKQVGTVSKDPSDIAPKTTDCKACQ
jgi:hypothetical protein